jgi:hypothetical protein
MIPLVRVLSNKRLEGVEYPLRQPVAGLPFSQFVTLIGNRGKQFDAVAPASVREKNRQYDAP